MDINHFAGLMAAQYSRPAVPVRQQLDVLRRLGIQLDETQEARFLDAPARYERPAYTAILSALGGEGSEQVYTLNAEAEHPASMYRELLRDLMRLTKGGLDLTGVEEGAAGEEGGPWRVSFRLNGNPYQYDADFLGGWLDLDFFPFLNRALEREGVEKRFITVDDFNLQGLLVFYRTPKWGQFLTAGTGLTVKDT